MLTIVLMTALDNRYAPIKSDFSLNSDTYADMSLHELEKKSIKWVVSHKMLVGSSGMTLALAVCGGLPLTLHPHLLCPQLHTILLHLQQLILMGLLWLCLRRRANCVLPRR